VSAWRRVVQGVTVATIQKSQAAGLYSTAAQPAGAALGTLVTQAGAWNANTTRAEAQADVQPALASVIALEPKLQTLMIYYPAAATDLKAEIAAAGVIQGDMASVGTVDLANASTWTQKLTSDVAALNAAGKLVRSDLGLPPSSQH